MLTWVSIEYGKQETTVSPFKELFCCVAFALCGCGSVWSHLFGAKGVVFMLPMYFLYFFAAERDNGARSFLIGLVLIAIAALLVSLRFFCLM